jgi:hypothetical protein
LLIIFLRLFWNASTPLIQAAQFCRAFLEKALKAIIINYATLNETLQQIFKLPMHKSDEG